MNRGENGNQKKTKESWLKTILKDYFTKLFVALLVLLTIWILNYIIPTYTAVIAILFNIKFEYFLMGFLILIFLISIERIIHHYKKQIILMQENIVLKENEISSEKEEYENKIKGLEETYIDDYACVVKNFETFVTNYHTTIIERPGDSLYNVTFLVCDNLKPKKKSTFEKEVAPFVDNYIAYQNQLEKLCEKPKKLEKKKFEESVGKFKRIIESSGCIFEHFDIYWDEFKNSEINTETRGYRIDEYNKFYENYRVLKIENKQISNQLNSLNIRTNFIIPKAKLPDKL